MIRKCGLLLGDIRWGIFFSNRFVGELYEAIDVMIFVYAKPHESMFVLISVLNLDF